MAKPGDIPKSMKKKAKEDELNQIKPFIDPNPDPYNFDAAINKLKEDGFCVEKQNGILMITIDNKNISKNINKIENIIHDSSIDFKGSWGIQTKQSKIRKDRKDNEEKYIQDEDEI